MRWFKKNKEILPEKQEASGFFTTDWDFSLKPAERAAHLQRKMAISFQQGIDSIKLVSVPGVALDERDGIKTAFDEQYQDLTQAKLATSRFQVGIPDAQVGWYAGQGFIGWQFAAMLSQNWLIDKACSMPAKDACRNGYEVTVNDGLKVKPEVLE